MGAATRGYQTQTLMAGLLLGVLLALPAGAQSPQRLEQDRRMDQELWERQRLNDAQDRAFYRNERERQRLQSDRDWDGLNQQRARQQLDQPPPAVIVVPTPAYPAPSYAPPTYGGYGGAGQRPCRLVPAYDAAGRYLGQVCAD